MTLANVSLDDKYALASGRAYMTGIQALVRLPMLQRQRDLAAGHNTAGFVSGYRGSPLGGVDQAFWGAKKHLEQHHVVFQSAVNEDLAATAVWGTQQVNMNPGAKYDGVFAMWYGKGPGVDRSGDVFRHANAAGTSKLGGVLVIAGDDHGAKSSTLPHQTEHLFKSMMMPVLAPAGVQEYLDYGIHGFALSRYSGCWVAFKALADTVETSAPIEVDPQRVTTVIPPDFALPPGGLNIRWPDTPLVQEERLLHHKLYAALAYCRANGLNRIVIDSPQPRLGIITSGKSYLDVRQALDDLGIDDALAAEIGIRLYKIGMTWPLEAEGVRHFAEGLEEILVIEEKRQLLEYQLKEELYNWREDVRPRVVGKFDEKGEWALRPDGRGHLKHGDWLLPAASELTPAMIARAIASRIAKFHTSPQIEERLAFLKAKEAALARPRLKLARTPHFCSGCPHNTSTKVPEGSRVLAGIGCHYMATWLRPESTGTFTQMGGEGVPWVGQSPFTETRHVFANLGDGTYFHSGLLAIRQAVSAFNHQPPAPLPAEGGDRGSLRSQDNAGPALGRPGARAGITYKILFNDAVAMTGGQPVDGTLTVPQITQQLAAEGVQKIVVVTDEPEKYRGVSDLAAGVPVRHRDELDLVQRELRETAGVSALIYDQTCAAEKRRRRKRGKMADPARRVFINEHVCEGCGDCSDKSFCMSVTPVETEFGVKREIDQSACNKDFSCVKGFCPSFVTVEGGRLKKGQALGTVDFPDLPEPAATPDLATPWGVLVTGVGGTGVVTIGALLGMAAHLEGKGVTVLDMAGLAQKGGAVWSHIRFADRQEKLHATRIAAGEANALIGCDLVVAVGDETLAKLRAGFSRAVVNSDVPVTSEFVRAVGAQARTGDRTTIRDPQFPIDVMESQLADAVGAGQAEFVDAARIATRLLGDAIATNLFMLGYAYQKGLIPVSAAAIERAIELNGAAVEMNRQAFLWGRRAAHDLPAVEKLALPATAQAPHRKVSTSLDELIARRTDHLTDYQDAAYAARYRRLVDRVRSAEMHYGSSALSDAVARSYHQLLAIKDEYEVARLYTDSDFLAGVDARIEGDYRIVMHLAPPFLARRDPATGEPQKRAFGPWMLKAMKLLARLKGLRGTAFDLFAGSEERRLDRQRLAEFEALIETVLAGLTADRLALAIELARLPLAVRGFGPVRARAAAQAKQREQELLAEFRASKPVTTPTTMPN